MDIQALMDAIGKAAADTRSQYHLTLGGLIAKLEAMPAGDCRILADTGDNPGKFSSYRGYYSDLAITPGDDAMTAKQLLKLAKACAGENLLRLQGRRLHHDRDDAALACRAWLHWPGDHRPQGLPSRHQGCWVMNSLLSLISTIRESFCEVRRIRKAAFAQLRGS